MRSHVVYTFTRHFMKGFLGKSKNDELCRYFIQVKYCYSSVLLGNGVSILEFCAPDLPVKMYI